MKDTVYTVNIARAISETLDGETIIIDLQSGTYFSLNQTASTIWELLKGNASVDDIARHLSQAYLEKEDVIQEFVGDFLKTLEQDQLIVQSQEQSSLKQEVSGEKQVFVIPEIKKYEDMQAMLLADPIHDVDVSGWPTLK